MGAHTARTVRTGHSAGPHERAQHGAGIYAVCFSNTHSAEAEKQVALTPTSPLLLHRCISCICTPPAPPASPAAPIESHSPSCLTTLTTTTPSPPPPTHPHRHQHTLTATTIAPAPPPHPPGGRQDLGGRGARPHQARQDRAPLAHRGADQGPARVDERRPAC